jgi:hypothetical protein
MLTAIPAKARVHAVRLSERTCISLVVQGISALAVSELTPAQQQLAQLLLVEDATMTHPQTLLACTACIYTPGE